MSNKLFQTVIHQMKDAIDKTFGVMDANNTIIACSELGRIGEQMDVSCVPVAEGFTDGGYTFKPVIASILRTPAATAPSLIILNKPISLTFGT